MMNLEQKKFRFVSSAHNPEMFEVISFTGSEGLSKLYRFEIMLFSDNSELDLEQIIFHRATLTILRIDGNIDFHGILVSFEQMLSVNGQSQYRAVLAPIMWRLTMTHHNQVFLDRTIPQIIESALKDGGLSSLDYEFRLIKSYPEREYVCMYNESHFSFISRWMEREGIYYYFEQYETSEKIIITDTSLVHAVMKEGENMYFSPISGLDDPSRAEVIRTFLCTQNSLPARVILKDYNYRMPALELCAEFQISERGSGDVYIYGEHFSTLEEGACLAKVRAEELKCRSKVFHGESVIPYLRPGYSFILCEHFRRDFNVRYLTTDVEHSGNQAFYFSAGLEMTTSEQEEKAYYWNSFSSIPIDSQFRPALVTEKPHINGTINAFIDAEVSSEYAELDSQGRYKVRLPFDISDAVRGKASSWIRMAQPYAGSNYGIHFPLHKGTEVLLTFVGGNPDRPIIMAAVTNPLSPSPVTSKNQTANIVCSSSGNRLEMEDEGEAERVRLYSPNEKACLHLGAYARSSIGSGTIYDAASSSSGANDSDSGFSLSTSGTGTIKSSKEMTIESEDFMVTTIGDKTTPPLTSTFFCAEHDAICGPASGDYYLTTKGRKICNIGSDLVVMAEGRHSEIITGTKSVHVKSHAHETIDGDLNQAIKGSLHQTVNGKETKTTAADVYHDVGGDHCLNVTGTGKHKWGAVENVFYGASSDVNLGAFDAVYVGARFQGHLGMNTLANFGNNNTLNLGAVFSLMLAVKLEIEYSAGIKIGNVRLNDSKFKVNNHAIALKRSDACVDLSELDISQGEFHVVQ
jgi:type VI secretion system secreted protein VgrG